jgi:hypothetical protein
MLNISVCFPCQKCNYNVLSLLFPSIPKPMGAVVVVIVGSLDLQLHVQSVPITAKLVRLNPVHGEVYSIKF